MDRILEKIFFEKVLTARWRLFQRFKRESEKKTATTKSPE